jgi:hypothetical protein
VAAEQLRPDFRCVQRFARPPVWEPELRPSRASPTAAPAQAPVLVPIVLREQPMVLLTERTTHLSTHSGQVAFPGGKLDDTDADAADTALREALGGGRPGGRLVEVLGSLPTYTTGTASSSRR